jgi:hypothetical protein
MQPQNITETLAALSAARIRSYQAFFNPGSPQELYGIYSWNDALSSCVTGLVNTIEITLRNAYHRELSKTYGPSGCASYNWYDIVGLQGKSYESVKGQTHRRGRGGQWIPRNPVPTPDDVISHLTLGFWKYLPDSQFTIHANLVNWPDILALVFPNKPNSSPAYWARLANQDKLFARLDLICDLRNRAAHLEPIWKFGVLYHEVRERRGSAPRQIAQPAPNNLTETLQRIKLVYNRSFELLHWLSAYRALDYKISPGYAKFRYLTSPAGFNAYRTLQPHKDLTLLQFARDIRTRKSIDGVVNLHHRGKKLFSIIPLDV